MSDKHDDTLDTVEMNVRGMRISLNSIEIILDFTTNTGIELSTQRKLLDDEVLPLLKETREHVDAAIDKLESK